MFYECICKYFDEKWDKLLYDEEEDDDFVDEMDY